jgi:CheY-like chemotaxis protein
MSAYKNIYLIDDDFIYLSITSKIMSLFFPDARVRSFANPEEALEKLEKDTPEVIFLDINMPGLDGWEFLAELEKIGQKNRNLYSIFFHRPS